MWTSSILLAFSLFTGIPEASECIPPSKQNLNAAIQYIGNRFHVDPQVIHISSQAKVGASCFWEIRLNAATSDRTLTFYLSPDRHHLSPDLYDMDVDPLLAEKAEQTKIVNSLMERHSPELGLQSAPITIVEFVDFQCPYCKQMADTFSRVRQSKDAPSDVKFVYRAFPLPMHSWAGTAAIAGLCVEKFHPELFWRFHDEIFAHQDELTSVGVNDAMHHLLAEEHILDTKALDKCTDDPATSDEVERDVELGTRIGVTSTPTIFINGDKFAGAQSIVQLLKAIDHARSTVSAKDGDE